ncbi:MAG: hypothetical protein O6939_12660 [Bacteroidetes bacterium]|nr:hypothetical protein [Bacteroidota bacterium]MCZ6694748.1 hypothetical protein [Bacteroidota bacterium]MCZ6900141.1 hypothetical protein [Bacteroidota bacterium]
MLSNQFKEDLAKIYELKPYVGLIDINAHIALETEKEVQKRQQRFENLNFWGKRTDFARSFYIPY